MVSRSARPAPVDVDDAAVIEAGRDRVDEADGAALDAVLQEATEEAARLLGAEGALLYRLDATSNRLQLVHVAGVDTIASDHWMRDLALAPGLGMFGHAVAERTTLVTGDYAVDGSFMHATPTDRLVDELGVRSMAVAPLLVGSGSAGEVLGALGIYSGQVDAFTAPQIALVRALASHAGLAIANARLIEELARSRETLRRQADVERALRELARRMMTMRDPGTVLQGVVDGAARLLGSAGAVIDLLDPASGEVRWAYDAGLDDPTREGWRARQAASPGVYRAIRERRVIVTRDYASDPRFADEPVGHELLAAAGIRSIAFAPLVGEAVVLGALTVFAAESDGFGDAQVELLGALADLATIAIRNAELIEELARSREETARRAETERTLREIAARVTAVRDPDTVLALIVDETRRVLGSDGAHLTRLAADGRTLRPVVVTGGRDDQTREWLRGQEFPIDGGINGMAAAQGRVVWTPEYVNDPRIPRDADDLETAARMELGAMAAAPLRAPGGEVIGTLAVSYRRPGPIPPDGLMTLQALADHAAIAVSNSDLLARVEASETRYRGLVQTSPDLIFEMDGEGVYTFYSDRTVEALGWHPSELIGRPFTEFIDMASFPQAAERLAEIAANPGRPFLDRVRIRHRDGQYFPFEVSVVGQVDEAGRLVAIRGVARDIRERDRLERELRRQAAELASSEERSHLARELHDSVTQALFSMTLLSRSIELLLDRDPAQVPERLAALRDLQREALAEMRALIFELRPGNVEEQGLVQALRTHTAALAGRLGLPVVVEADLPERPPIEVEDGLYRIAQEALHNVVKHAGAREVRVEIEQVPDGIRLRIVDDGRGFDPAAVPDGHLGLAGIRSRAERLGGTLSVRTAPSEGTTIEVVAPARLPSA
jgi:PAS domain S-box-containing protein